MPWRSSPTAPLPVRASIDAYPQSAAGIPVLLSAVLNGEALFAWNYLAALALVCVGIYLVNRAPQKKQTYEQHF